MKIDVFTHILPSRYAQALKKYAAAEAALLLAGTPTLLDLEARFRLMDKYGDYAQILTLAQPAVEAVAGPKESVQLAMVANDEMAELVAKYPTRFPGAVAVAALNSIDDGLKEIERAVTDLGMRGVLVYTSINGKPLDQPELMPLYEMMCRYDLPIWLHPRRELAPDYAGESRSQYYLWQLLGWPYETALAMARLVMGGVLEAYPRLKVITHHCGSMIPYFAGRIATIYDYTDARLGRNYKAKLSRPVLDYFRMFYNDTATYGWAPALMCGQALFGVDRLLFGTDTPFDNESGDRTIRETIQAVEQMDISEAERRKIFEGNVRALLRLPG